MFFSFDGVDGAGKSTQVALFVEWLRRTGYDVVACRDPGSTPLGERIREILLTDEYEGTIHRRTEMLLYMAARCQLVEEIIAPALAAGRTVVADRFVLANIVYQGFAGDLNVDEVRQVGHICTGRVGPDCVFILDLPPTVADRRRGRDLDRIERQGLEFQQRVRAGFLSEANRSPELVHVIDADRTIDVIQQEIQSVARPLLAKGVPCD